MTKQELQIIIQQGVGYYAEFKQNINSDLKKEMVAFANASGGSIYLGVNDQGMITGIEINNRIKSKIQDAANECDPPVIIHLNEIGYNVIQISIPESINKPHRTTSGFFLRVGANSQKMRTDAILEFLEKEGRVRFDERIRSDIQFNETFSETQWQTFQRISNISTTLHYKSVLRTLGAIKQKKKIYFTNAGLFVFTDHPIKFLPQAYMTGVAYRSHEKVDILDSKDFNRDFFCNIEDILSFIERHINVSAQINDTLRVDVWEVPKIALREAIINAIVHRDYLETGARILVEIFPDRIVISNPGGLPKGMAPSEFGHLSLTRNSVLANLMQRMHFIEKLGTGVPRMKQEMKNAKLPEPVFQFDHFFTVEFKRPEMSEKTSEKILAFIRENPAITIQALADNIGVSTRSIERNLKILQNNQLLKRVGPAKGGRWEIL